MSPIDINDINVKQLRVENRKDLKSARPVQTGMGIVSSSTETVNSKDYERIIDGLKKEIDRHKNVNKHLVINHTAEQDESKRELNALKLEFAQFKEK